MKKQILTLAAIAVLSSSVCMAQGPQRGEGRGPRGNMMEKMKTELSLSDEQAAKLSDVFKQARPSSDGQRPTREEMQKKREETDAKIKEILTEEQYTKYKKMQQERRPQRQGRKREQN